MQGARRIPRERLSRDSPAKGLLKWLGEFNSEEATRRVTIVLTALVHDPQIAMLLSIFVRHDSIELADF
jgi:hypothetical protein